MLDNFLLILFDKYAELLKRRFSEDFQEVRTHDLHATKNADISMLCRLFRLMTICQWLSTLPKNMRRW